MIQKARMRWNALLTFILSLFGFGTISCNMYGVPHGIFMADGIVTDSEHKPLQGMQVVIGAEDREFFFIQDTVYTTTDGKFHDSFHGEFPGNYCVVVVNDTSGVYESTTQSTNFIYTDSNKSFSWGTAYAIFEVTMQKK